MSFLKNSSHPELEVRMLRLLLALLREQQLSKTALALGVSIGTASRDLKTAREILGDKLFVRSGGEMVPTQRMLDMAPEFERVLEALEALSRPRAAFSPARSSETFCISAPDNAAATILLPAMARLRSEAPHMNFRVRMLEDTVFDELRSGETDLAVFCDHSLSLGPSFHKKTLLTSEHVLIMRKGHPLDETRRRRPLVAEDLAPYARIGIVLKKASGGGLREILDEQAVCARYSVTMPHFLAAAFFLVDSDDLLTLPLETARFLERLLPVTHCEDPVFAHCPWDPIMLWHERTDKSPSHQWLRAVIAEEAGRLPGWLGSRG